MRSPLALLAILFVCAGCNSEGVAPSQLISDGSSPTTTKPDPTGTTTPPAPSPTNSSRSWTTDALIFMGTGAWTGEGQSVETILTQHGMTYKEVTSAELDTMSVDDLAQYGVIVWPGGSGSAEGNSFSQQTHANIRTAVRERGVGYLGFCAGAWLAVAPASVIATTTPYIGMVEGPILDYYTPANQSNGAAMTTQVFPDGTSRQIIWIGGPQTPDTGVIARYSTGEPAISEIWAGKGLVVITGGHPAAPAGAAGSYGLTDSDGPDFDLTYQLLNAALNQQPLPSF